MAEVTVNTLPVLPVRPEIESVKLTLSAAEFKALSWLLYQGKKTTAANLSTYTREETAIYKNLHSDLGHAANTVGIIL